jgi:hypothetical protein
VAAVILEQLLDCAIDEAGDLPVMIPAPGGDFVEVTGCEVAELAFITGETGLAFLLVSQEKHKPDWVLDSDPIHEWFELSRAQYLTIPRSVLQSMPTEWQQRFTQCLEELDEAFDWRPESGRYWVQLKNDKGHFVHDPLQDYERGRRRLPLRSEGEG